MSGERDLGRLLARLDPELAPVPHLLASWHRADEVVRLLQGVAYRRVTPAGKRG